MLSELKLLTTANDERIELLSIANGQITLGREPENEVVIDSNAVSRRHGTIFSAGGQWLFRDLDSTNGSWVNGVKVSSGHYRLLRDGDVLQLSDFRVEVDQELPLEPDEQDRPASLLVFVNEEFQTEFPLTVPGAGFRLGGRDADFFVDGLPPEELQVEIVTDGNRLQLITGEGGGLPVNVNGLVVRGTTALADRDDVKLGAFHLIVNDPKSSNRYEPAQIAGQGRVQGAVAPAGGQTMGRNWDTDSDGAGPNDTSGRRYIFGTEPDGEEAINPTGTLSMRTHEFTSRAGFEMSPAQRFAGMGERTQGTGSVLSERLLIFLGVVVFVLLLILLVFIFKRV